MTAAGIDYARLLRYTLRFAWALSNLSYGYVSLSIDFFKSFSYYPARIEVVEQRPEGRCIETQVASLHFPSENTEQPHLEIVKFRGKHIIVNPTAFVNVRTP
ncbi:hypothetical protein ED312_06055 [Sinomicrobium pectinilyticum]|uniref:Uncharacterized protein n=1 Tax=Sinomicrobium pectinilyticum TaxID=1084421 RepID=A0A3N0ESI3_SINP1|nr:hypothetical protein ED312_06055 [Sinomicrobium pectinilyticum]